MVLRVVDKDGGEQGAAESDDGGEGGDDEDEDGPLLAAPLAADGNKTVALRR